MEGVVKLRITKIFGNHKEDFHSSKFHHGSKSTRMPSIKVHSPTRQIYVPREKRPKTSLGRPHMVLYVTPRDVSSAGRPWDVLRMSI